VLFFFFDSITPVQKCSIWFANLNKFKYNLDIYFNLNKKATSICNFIALTPGVYMNEMFVPTIIMMNKQQKE